MNGIRIATVATLLCAFIILFAIPNNTAYAQLPFGGPIITPYTCANGLWISIGPPGFGGGSGGGLVFYIPGLSFSYIHGPPSHSGQQLLGMVGPPSPCLVPCPAGLCPIGYGLTIEYHGSSI